MRQTGAFGRALSSVADAFRVPNLRRLEIAWSRPSRRRSEAHRAADERLAELGR